MLSSARLTTILSIAIPISLGMLSQTLLNLIDTSMVRELGNAALAAVGLASFANFVAGAPIMGLSAGVQAMAARRVGEDRLESAAQPLNGGLLVCLGFGVPWVLALALTASWWFPRLAASHDIAEVGLPYLYCRLAATVLVGMHFSFRAYWNATGRSSFYMLNLLAMHALNVLLNWVLIYGHLGAPKLGVTGAGIANATASLLGVAGHFLMGMRVARPQGFLHGLPSREVLRTMLQVSLPTSFQQFFFAAGMTTLMALLARAGTEVAAASKVLLDLVLAALLPAMGFGMAGTTLVSQALGRLDLNDAKSWGWDVSQTAFCAVLLLSLPALLFPEVLLAGFLKDPATIELAHRPLRLIAGTVAIDGVGMVLQSCLIGAGDSRRVMLVSLLMQWGLILPVVALMVLVWDLGMLPVWSVQAAVRVLQAGAFALMWKRGKWQGIRV
jgi:MATE family multidrug resistance protein